jgi:predicted dehydrogenase
MTIKILVVGTGSIGIRHISNLRNLGVDVSAFSYRSTEFVEPIRNDLYGVRLVKNLKKALRDEYDAIIVANRTHQHMEVALQAARNKKNLFIEKPLSISIDGCKELQELTNAYNLVVETGFMLRFHPNLVWIKKYLLDGKLGELMHIQASVGQWLPDWRPESDYRIGYGAFRDTGGGVIFDLVHELDLVSWIAGKIVDVNAMTRYVKCLDIETEAIAQISLRLESGVLSQVHLDYVHPGYERELKIVGTKGMLSWDYSRGMVFFSDSTISNKILHCVSDEFQRNTMFNAHMTHFINRLKNTHIGPASSIKDGIQNLKVALACHKSSEERRYIRPEEIDEKYLVKG